MVLNDLKVEFTKLATKGFIGDPEGEDAYAYLRASSERQVEEGSSFPRQIKSIHTAAKRDTLRVKMDLIFFDDGYSGFEIEQRPALNKLLEEVESKPQAFHLIIEDVDRLSRNADWHQGFLIEKLFRSKIEVHFFIHPGSQLERYIRGYLAQEGMKKDIERMRLGNKYKAKDGRVTARRPRYGYTKTDPKDTYYELHPEESKVIRWVYEKLIYEGLTLPKIAKEMNDRGIPTTFKAGFWTASTLYQMVRSPVYKGDFYANRYYFVNTGEFNEKGRPKKTTKQRPKEEWIKVDVPQIVSPEEWDLSREVLSRNAKRSTRNAKKRKWLLAGFLKCAICRDFTLVAIRGSSKKSPIRYHGCSSRQSEKSRILGTACYSPYVHADELELRVWEEVERVIYDPYLIINRLQQREREGRKKKIAEQLVEIERNLTELEKVKEKYEAAYERDIYNLDEFEEKMKGLQQEREGLESQKVETENELSKARSFEDQKRVVLVALGKIKEKLTKAKKEKRQPNEIPFDLKRKVLGLLVEKIWVDTGERIFTIEGVIKGTFALDSESIPFEMPQRVGESVEFAFESTRKLR